MAKKLKIWNGASWEDVTFAITPPTTNVTNEFTTNQVIDVSTSAAALRITQRGAGPAIRIEDDTNPDSTPFIIDSDGLMVLGGNTRPTVGGLSGHGLTLYGAGQSRIASIRAENSASGSAFYLGKSRNTAIGTFTIVQNNDGLGRFAFYGDNGVDLNSQAAEITVQVDGTPSSTSMPGRILFSTTPSGSILPTERMRIHSNGNISIGTSTNDGKVLISSGNPTTELNIRAYDDASKMMTVQADNNVFRFISRWTNGTGGHIAWSTGQPISERLRLTDSGQFYLSVAQDNAQPRIRNTYTSTGTPSGGNDGDVWLTYTA